MPGPVVYVPSRVGESYFTDWQAPVAGDNGRVWAYNHGTGKFEPYTIPTVAPGGSSGYIQYNNAGLFGASGVYWDSVNSRVGIGTATPDDKLSVVVSGSVATLGGGTVSRFINAGNSGSNSRVAIIAGNAALSSLDFGDTDLQYAGFVNYNHSSNRMSFGINGVDKMIIDTNGNVGISQPSPSQKLDVNGSVNVATALIVPVVRPAADSTTAVRVTKADGITSIITVDTTNGRVGVGTTIPANRLEVAGDHIRISNGFSLVAKDSGGASWAFSIIGTKSGSNIVQIGDSTSTVQSQISLFTTGASTPDVVFKLGSVGIGQLSPTAWLHLPASTTSYASLRIPSGTAPTSPNDGDVWYNGTDFYLRSTSSYSVGSVVRTTSIRPLADSTTALQMQNAAGTAVVTVDTTNSAFGVESTLYKLSVGGAAKNTVYYGLNTGAAASGDTINYAVISNQLTTLNGFNYTAKCSSDFISRFANSDNASATAHTKVELSTSTANGGDPKMVFTISGVLNWCAGVDNSDSDKYKISRSDSPGSSDILVMDANGVYVTGKLGVSSAVTNTNTPSGATAKAMPIYDATGALLGYIPVYAAQW